MNEQPTPRWLRLDATWDESAWIQDLRVRSGVAALAWPQVLSYVKLRGVAGRVKAPSVAHLARWWNVPAADLQLLLDAATSGEEPAMVIEGGTWAIANWDLYQKPDRTNADRQRRFRERARGG